MSIIHQSYFFKGKNVWFFKIFSWRIIALQCCVGFCHTWTWIGHRYTYVPEKAMAPHSSTLAWKIPWTEEPGRLQSMGSLRVGHNWVTSRSLFTFTHWRRKWQPTAVFLPGESQGWGSRWATVYGVEQSWTQLTWFSSSICMFPPSWLSLPPPTPHPILPL